MHEPYACAILGAGPAGCACAATLHGLGFRTLLISRSPGRRRQAVLETIHPRARTLAEALFASKLPDSAAAPLAEFHSAWSTSTLDVRDCEFWLAGPCAVVDRAQFDQWLLDQTRRLGVDYAECGHLTRAGCENEPPWTITLETPESPRCVRAQFAVNAAGRAAAQASTGFPQVSRTYTDRLICLALRCTTPGVAASAFAMVESAAQGWWYAAADGRGECSLGFFTDAGLLPAAGEQRTWLARQLAASDHLRAMAPLVARLDLPLHVLDARTSFSSTLAGRDWVAAGDAGWALDPLSGSGIERALRSGCAAGQAIAQCLGEGHPTALRALEKENIRRFRKQLAQQAKVYASEPRWRHQPFWALRGTATSRHFESALAMVGT